MVLLPLLLLASWLTVSIAVAGPLPVPPGPLDTNLFNTNGLVVPPDVQFLLRDLRTNLDQLEPFLALINGETNATNLGRFGTTNTLTPPASPRQQPNSEQSNGIPLIYGIGAALENVQTDLNELLPRLAAMVGQTNYSSNSLSTNATQNRFTPPKPAPHSKPGTRAALTVRCPHLCMWDESSAPNTLKPSHRPPTPLT